MTETVEFRFVGGDFTFAFREISTAETDGVTFLECQHGRYAHVTGNAGRTGRWKSQRGNPLKVTWHFSPTSDAAHVFTVRYQADGLIRKGNADTLIWRAIPEVHDYSITNSTITLTHPSKATLLEAPTLSRGFINLLR